MKRSLTKKIIFFCLCMPLWCLFASAAVPSTNQVRVSEKLSREKRGCISHLVDTIQQTLFMLRAQRATVHLGTFAELEKLLIKAGVNEFKAKRSIHLIQEIHDGASNYPVLQFSIAVFDQLVQSKKIMVCPISTKCDLASANQNFLVFTEKHEGIILLPPPHNTIQFAIHFFDSMGTLAGDRILLEWLKAGYAKEQQSRGTADRYYREYAIHYDGRLPPDPDSSNQAFTITFMRLYKTLLSSELFAVVHPEISELNNEYLARTTYNELMTGQNHRITSEMVTSLQITETNLMARARDILATMLATISSDLNQ